MEDNVKNSNTTGTNSSNNSCKNVDLCAFEFIQLANFFSFYVAQGLTSDQKFLLGYFLSIVSENLNIFADFEEAQMSDSTDQDEKSSTTVNPKPYTKK